MLKHKLTLKKMNFIHKLCRYLVQEFSSGNRVIFICKLIFKMQLVN